MRACVYRLAEALDLPVLGLVDCNPYGEKQTATYLYLSNAYGGGGVYVGPNVSGLQGSSTEVNYPIHIDQQNSIICAIQSLSITTFMAHRTGHKVAKSIY